MHATSRRPADHHIDTPHRNRIGLRLALREALLAVTIAGLGVACSWLQKNEALGAVTTTGDVTPDPTTTTSSDNLYVGDTAAGSMTIDDGSDVNSNYGYIGNAAGSSGDVTVDGPGSTWANANQLRVGQGGTASLDILNGGQVSSGSSIYVAYISGVTGEVLVDGAGSTMTSGGIISLGQSGTGSLTISNGATVSSVSGAVMHGQASISGPNSVWNCSSQFSIGNSSTVSITNGGSVTADFSSTLSGSSATSVTLTVDGPGSNMTSGNDLTITNASIQVTNGGELNNLAARISLYAGSVSEVVISGAGSAWTLSGPQSNSGSLTVGGGGTGTLQILAGATVTNNMANVGYGASSSGQVTVSGAGSTWTNGDLTVGTDGGADVDVTSGAVLEVAGYTWLGGTATLNVTGGATANTASVWIGRTVGSDATLVVDGAGSTWTAGYGVIVGFSGAGSLQIGSGASAQVAADLTLGFQTDAQGTVDLTGGTLDMQGNDVLVGPGAATFNFTGGVLKNVGTFAMDLQQQGGTLAAGNSPGEMVIDGDYTLGAGATLEVELAGAGGLPGVDYDHYDVLGLATLTGTLNVLSEGGFDPAYGESFDVLTADSIDATGLSLDAFETFTFVIVPDDGRQVLRLVAVPEPNAALLGGVAILIIARRHAKFRRAVQR